MSEQPPGDPAAAAARDGETDVETNIEPADIEPADVDRAIDDSVPEDRVVEDDLPVETLDPEPARTEIAPTGDQQVDTALGRLPELDRLGTAEHVAVYEDVHRTLQEALGAAGSGTGAPGGPRPAVPGPPRR